MKQAEYQFQTNESVSCLDISREFLACGTLDEKIFVWKYNSQNGKPYLKLENQLIGIVDLQIDENETKIATSCLDSMIRIWDLEDTTKCSEIKCDAFENWKIRFLDNYTIVTAGESGTVSMFHTETKDRIAQVETDKIYYATSLRIQQRDYDSQLLCVGNDGGYIYLISNQKVQSKIKPHGKAVKDICFLSSNKLLTASDDGLIKLIDLETQQVEGYFCGHKYGINALDQHPNDEKVFVSCAQDRTIRLWNINQKNSTQVISAGVDKPEQINSVKFTKDSKYVCAAHQSGIVAFYNY